MAEDNDNRDQTGEARRLADATAAWWPFIALSGIASIIMLVIARSGEEDLNF